MKRKRIADTTTGAVGMLMEALQGPPDAPSGSTLLPRDIPYWDAIVATRPRSEWTSHDLQVAVLTAKSMTHVAALQAQLEESGALRETSRGDVQINPVATALDSATRRMLSLKRSLGLATDPENTIARTDAYAKSREVAEQLREEPLLAQ